MNQHKFKYRRQFILLPHSSNNLTNWREFQIQNSFLYVHPSCESQVLIKDKVVVIIGFVIDPTRRFENTEEILNSIAASDSIDSLTNILYPLTGRFVLLIKDGDKLFFFNDPCGFRSLYYYKIENKVYAASDPMLLSEFTKLEPLKSYDKFFKSNYFRKNSEYYLPIGYTLYKGVHRLCPNHFYSTSEKSQTRFWPTQVLERIDLNDAVNEFSQILKNTMDIAANKYKLALPITAGLDSRILLSTSRNISDEIYYYTLIYRELELNSPDIKIPGLILDELGFYHNILDCSKDANSNLLSIYNSNSYLSHMTDWCKIVCNMIGQYPENYMALKGSCCEIGRSNSDAHGITLKMVRNNPFVLVPHDWEEMVEFKDSFMSWYEEATQSTLNLGYDIRALFYWEQRMGSWQAQSQLEWDMVQEELSPFNNRMLIDIMLRVDEKYRSGPKYTFFNSVIKHNWPNILKYPINPIGFKMKVKLSIKNLLYKIGFHDRLLMEIRNFNHRNEE